MDRPGSFPPDLTIDEGVRRLPDGRWIATYGKEWKDRTLDTLSSHTLAFMYWLLQQNGAPAYVLTVVKFWGVRNLTEQRVSLGSDDLVLAEWIAIRKLAETPDNQEALETFDSDETSPFRAVEQARALLQLDPKKILAP